MSSATEAALRKAGQAGSSPLRRRVTRSQSREAEEAGLNDARKGKGRLAGADGKTMDVIAEETLIYNSPRKSKPDHGRSLDPLEDPMNISGTTILPLDSEPDSDLDPVMMLDTLPILAQTARDMLDFLVPRSADPVSIVDMARRMSNPGSTQSRRLNRFTSTLKSEAKYFGNQTYIDVGLVRRSILPTLENKLGGSARWSPDLILYRANCARFALEVLLAGVGNRHRDVINGLEGRFPGPFMNGLVNPSLERPTFELALDIRTQFLVMELEAHQDEYGFDPLAILDSVFFDVLPEEIDDDEERPLRGFGVGFEDLHGRLPERFKDSVYDRINDIRLALAGEDDDEDTIDIKSLKTAYRWRTFGLRAARWVRKMDDMIARELKEQRNVEDIRTDFFQSPQGRHGFDGTSGSPFTGRDSIERMQRGSSTRDTPTPSHSTPTRARGRKSPQREPDRRKSKGPFRNALAIGRMMDRLRDADTQSDLIRATPQRAGLQDHEPGFNSNSHTRLEEPRRQTLGAFEGRATLEVPRTWPEREDRRHTLDALGVREPTAELTRRSPEQGQSQFSTHTEEAQTEAERAAEAGREAQREAQRSAPREPERPIIPESPEPSPAPALYDDELFVPQGVDDILAEPDRLKPAISNGATPKANHLTDRSHTPSAETIYKMAARRAKDNPTSGPSRPAPTTTPADASRRAFIDRQQDAQRVSPISQSDVQSADRSRTLRSRKRTNEAVEDSDEEFAQDDRTVNIADRRAQKPNKSPAKRRRTEPSTQEPSSSTTHPPAAPRAPSEIPSPNPPRPSQPATQQQVGMEQPYRRRWTTEQTNGLIKYIEETGPKWAVIKAADNARPEAMGGNLFKHRSNVQLKDKARNLKKHFIKNGIRLPLNFDGVTMSKEDWADVGRRV